MPTHKQDAKETAKALRLQQAAKEAIGPLYPAEIRLLDKVPRTGGDWALTGPSDQEVDNDAVKEGKEWRRNREIRSELLRWLCIDEYARKQVDSHGLNVMGAKIIGPLDLSYVAVPFQLLLQRCYFETRLNLFQSEIPALVLTGSRVPGIDAGSSKIKGHVWLNDGFRCDGGMNFETSHIGGDLHCSGGVFCNPPRNGAKAGEQDPESGIAFFADAATVDGSVFLRRDPNSEKTFQAEGQVSLIGAQVQGDLDCGGGIFSNVASKAFPKSGVALDASRLIVRGGVFLRDGFDAKGQVRMLDAEASFLDCEGGTFKNPFQKGDDIGGDALVLDRAVIKGAVLFRSPQFPEDEKKPGFSADGNLSLIAARIGGPLDMKGGDFTKAALDLSGATAASIFDSGKEGWPKPNKLYLRLFQYGQINPEVAKDRLLWLALQPDDDFNTESYVQLAKVLQQAGDDDGARLVLQTAQELETRHGHRYWYLRPDNWFAASIGYGYRPIWAAGYISIMSALGWIFYRRAYLAGTMVPTEKDAYDDIKSNRGLPPYYPPFAALIFSLENSLPLVKLGQADKWHPDAESSPHATPPPNREPPLSPSLIDSSSSATASGNTKVVAAELGTTDHASVGKVIERPPGDVSLAHYEPIADPLPPMFAAVRRGVRSMLCAAGLKPDTSGQTPKTALSRRGTSATFLKWFIWIQILLGWLFATLFVAGYTGIVRK